MTAIELRRRGGRRRSGWVRPLALGLLAALLVICAGFVVWLIVRHYHDSVALAGRTTATTPIELSIAGVKLAIPANMIRTARQRQGGAVERVDLAVNWPDLRGYSEATAEDFRSGSPLAPLIYISIAAADAPLDSTERLESVYSRFFSGEAVAGPSGLIGRSLSKDSGYGGEQVFFEPGENRPYVARCIAKATPEVPATCMRDVRIAAGLSMLYRFDRFYLGDWQDMDTRLRELAAGFQIAR